MFVSDIAIFVLKRDVKLQLTNPQNEIVGTPLHVGTEFVVAGRVVPVQSEHCEAETFRASCPFSTVIVVRRALYGRMRLGRCVLRDYGYVGCFADVVAHMDVICSGRRTCSIRIPDAMLDRANPCPKDFKTYLLISYDCVPGAPVLHVRRIVTH